MYAASVVASGWYSVRHFFPSCTQLLRILDAIDASHFQCFNIAPALNDFADKELPARTQDGLPRNADAKCTARTHLAEGFRYVTTVNGH